MHLTHSIPGSWISISCNEQELSKQADTRLQLWSKQWRVDDNYYQPLSTSGAAQLADALCIAVANAGHPQLCAEVAVRNKYFFEQIGELALNHHLQCQQPMQTYRARLHVTGEATLQSDQHPLAVSCHYRPGRHTMAANHAGRVVPATPSQREAVENAAGAIGKEILQQQQLHLDALATAKVKLIPHIATMSP